MRPPILFLVGPTASGKTALSLCLARRLGCEIISADSMVVYRGMNIGTAKPTSAERRQVRHHLIDIVPPRSIFSVYHYRKLALQAIQEILDRGRIPLVVGGTGLYLSALWHGLSNPPGTNAKLRKRLYGEARGRIRSLLYARLKKIDPVRAREIHPNDLRRIVRALEIAELSGKPPSASLVKRESLEDLGFSVRAFGIAHERARLYERINRRVERMFRKGFLNEVKRLKRWGFSKTARQALGYREVLESLERGAADAKRGELVRKIQARTRQFAKRQLTWFRREKEIHWIPWGKSEPASTVCGKIVKEVREWSEKEPFLS